MSTLRSVPEWVVPPLRAVEDTEQFLLRVFGTTRAPQALGSWVSLSWLGAEDGEQTRGPLGEGLPTESAALAALLVADAIAESAPYPGSKWWAARGIAPADRISADGWAARVGDGYTRQHMHGVTVALAWLLGQLPDPRLMARCSTATPSASSPPSGRSAKRGCGRSPNAHDRPSRAEPRPTTRRPTSIQVRPPCVERSSPARLCRRGVEGVGVVVADLSLVVVGMGVVESAWGAVPGFLPARFPRPLAEPAVRVSTQRALHGFCH
ncbi:hypothetical protein [Pseudonocardia dioxanivorans]|uniref:hypothetical protein n=1 Tax=Pseudonocardia dioxanivorans TaxID=240495 RepID=UPI0005A20D15|nr:hypothetical protein [Pseudonocardia dioxanivorans]